MTLDPEGDLTVDAFEGPGVRGCGCSEGRVDVDLVEVADGAFVLLELSLGPEGDRPQLSPEGPLKVVNVDMKPQLRRFREDLAADAAHRLAFVVHLKDLVRV